MTPKPNTRSDAFEGDDSKGNDNSKRLEILYEGRYYDVTEFIRRHPGGNVIKFYTEQGEDATQAIQQFHNRSINKIHLMLKSFRSRPASPDEFGLKKETLVKHQALTDDFARLFVEMKREGLFEPSYWRILYRSLEIVTLFISGFWLLSFPERGIFQSVCGSALLGVGGGRSGWLMHEGGHHSLTGIPKLDRFISSLFVGLGVGLSAGWWSRGHNKHHAMPQRLNHDVDLNTMPFLAYNAKVVKSQKEGKSFWIQNQVWLFLSIDCFLGYWAWRIFICPRNAWKQGDYLDLFFMSFHWIGAFMFVPTWPEFFLLYWIGANYMFGNFALSHTHLPVTEEQTHWVEYGLTHTANIDSSPLVDWWMGFLNFQIEHHLFPTLPQYKSHLIAPRVKALALKHNLPYHSYSYTDAWRRTLQNFADVAKKFNQ